ncbi:MAG TPA: type 4a pilus biogenesis protein PilO [Desulfuromonadales bacterium]|nr:type 4a pilus biogenesis protein PilO [Desulfuromonadales bacterium]
MLLVLALGLVVVAFVYLLYLPQQQAYQDLQRRHNSLETRLAQERRIARNLPEFKAEYAKMQQKLHAALAELPNQREIPSLLTSISSLANDNGLDVLRFKPDKERSKGFYAEVPVELNLVGTFPQVTSFFFAVGQLPRIVNISNVSMGGGKSKSSDDRNLLSVKCLATTFRFLEKSATKKRKR